jgi:purine-binding chemotaxis protein CheW
MAEQIDELGSVDEAWADDDESTAGMKYLFFHLGEELYGINIMNVTEIIEMQPITELPDMADYIRGVINLRGKVIPVIDLRLRFGMAGREYDDRTCIIIADIDTASLGMIVDTVAEVHDVPQDRVEAAPSGSNGEEDHYIHGVARVEERVTILLDAQKILQARELQAVKSTTR